MLASFVRTLKLVNRAKIAEIKPEPINTGNVGVMQPEMKAKALLIGFSFFSSAFSFTTSLTSEFGSKGATSL